MNQTIDEPYFLNPVNGCLVKKINGVPEPIGINPEAIKYACETYKPRKNDIWVVTYPKSGTMWTSYDIFINI